ncbi:acyl-CoA N-acyltransferase [Xylogone sp. PMI_703]|nr:acyl-CoA N-acyltransferase [Xylogone sp. PMI_703]
MQSISEQITLFKGSEPEIHHIWALWSEVLKDWPIVLPRLKYILTNGGGRHYIHDHGFCLSYLADDAQGKIAVIAVHPDHRGKGIGSALIDKARENVKSMRLSSSFPRFWPGVPMQLSEETKSFFHHRGFKKLENPTPRDLFRDISNDVAPPDVISRVEHLPYKFIPWSHELYGECMVKQNENFGKNQSWVQAYERLAGAGQHQEVMVAVDPETGKQVGWTLMCSPSSVVSQDFAFLPLAPTGEQTGLIACVGVDEAYRGKGIGLALLIKGMQNMRERGMKGILIDWVVIRGFYETLGFKVIWEYEDFEWLRE